MSAAVIRMKTMMENFMIKKESRAMVLAIVVISICLTIVIIQSYKLEERVSSLETNVSYVNATVGTLNSAFFKTQMVKIMNSYEHVPGFGDIHLGKWNKTFQ